MRLLVALTLALSLNAADPVPAVFSPGARILFQGDSITDMNRGRTADPNHILGHSYAFLIAAKYGAMLPERNLVFINRGVSGNKVSDLVLRWQKDTLDLKPDLLSILIGINDTSRQVPVEEYEKQYDQLLADTMAAYPHLRLVLAEPFTLPVGRHKDDWDTWRPEVGKRQAAVARLALKYHAALVPYQKVFDDAAKKPPADYWIWDAVHPTYSGQQLMADAWIRTVADFWPASATESHYRSVENWAQFPEGVTKWGSATGVDVDAKGNVYVLHRNEAMPIMVFDRNGKFLRAWGQGMFKTTHFLRVDHSGNVWVTDRGSMQAFKFNFEGKLLMTIGRKDVRGDNTSHDTFNGMADIAVAKNGTIFIADGEGPNTRVAKFSKDGKFIKWWGGKGTGPGQFDVPHSIALDAAGRVYVADRSNNRIQIFDQNGKFLNQWTNFGTPWGLFIKGDRIYVVDGTDNNCLLIANLKDGKILEKITGLKNATAVTVDANDTIYIGEVNGTNVKKFVKPRV